MEANLKLVLEKARRADLRAVRTEIAAFGNVLAVKATVLLGNQEFTAHALAALPEHLIEAEAAAILRAFQFAGLGADGVAPTPSLAPAPARESLFDNSGPLYPELDGEPEEEEEELEGLDRDNLLAESTSLMAALKMDSKAGRSYLMETYGKRSRNELTDPELDTFVQYLRAQTHNQNTSKLPF